jgi:hypothetical protein
LLDFRPESGCGFTRRYGLLDANTRKHSNFELRILNYEFFSSLRRGGIYTARSTESLEAFS